MYLHVVSARSGSIALGDSQYGYFPHEYVAIIFVVLFSMSTILHLGQATYYRMWWLFPTVCLCGIGEILGWSGRLWSSFSPSFYNPFMMQIVSTVIAPTPLIAVNFILLSWLVRRLGPCYARLTPIRYAIVFVACDTFALVIQAVGGGIASSAADLSGATLGANIMLSGIVVQFTAIVVYCILALDFLLRYNQDRPLRSTSSGRGLLDSSVRTMILALTFSTLVLFIRSIYRIIELAGGWHGRVLHTEVYFNVLDGGMVVLAIVSLNLAHPGRLLGSRRPAQPAAYATK
ncbi:RTA1 like protein-domain-containing protein [Mycena rosella]|uniref:RTA1 like protein-domain-containing protein n=1 Tax=Mycena rosella TaxID=1033263 RepID=A0AAD7DHP9_MYCRO|nr:RTA1 like protein-domain-containing protein [Mycena rosella]